MFTRSVNPKPVSGLCSNSQPAWSGFFYVRFSRIFRGNNTNVYQKMIPSLKPVINAIQPVIEAIRPRITVILTAIFAALAFTGGYLVSDWRSASQLQRLNSQNAILSAASEKCALDIRSVRTAMTTLTEVAAEREKNATEAMRHASAVAAKHTSSAKKTRALPAVAAEHQYEAITREQIEYVQSRHQTD
ncbi:hypothetical protein Nmul_A1465 [Nitrosospira multiformis ATCC 25196]|uniref:Uncharacterized protein n=3 Tax=Nitrosospira multiformis TaxID=1231 RepID=Q2Y903_NITMU|nr:hypothetical protein Nmul_A1465 [Nitrosospira multiformis ATCC 25196]